MLPWIRGGVVAAFIVSAMLVPSLVRAQAAPMENGYEAWLRYRALPGAADHKQLSVLSRGDSTVLRSAASELRRGLGAIAGQDVLGMEGDPRDGSIVLIADPQQAPAALRTMLQEANLPSLGEEGFLIRSHQIEAGTVTVIAGNSDRGVLYGAFALLRALGRGQALQGIQIQDRPAIALRMINQWDNLNGTVERGYAGPSIFDWDKLPELDGRYRDYARLMASVGINAVAINNVNAGYQNNIQMLTPEYLKKVAALSEVFEAYGIQLYLSVGFDAPRSLGGLESGDPLDGNVKQWWRDKADEIYALMPNFGGFLIKADSEGQAGPYRYNRNHADGANMLAEALRPHGGTLIWRAFVYKMTPGADRVAMAYEHFDPLDGAFADNVMLQVKNGPLDFQVREPVHPLLAAMPKTREVLELQITQEYTGHATHLCYLVPSWKEVLDFNTYLAGDGPTVAERLAGAAPAPSGGITGVLNIGQRPTWLGNHLAMANFYGYARLAWDPTLSSEAIAEEWARLTFGNDPRVVETLVSMLLDSYEAYGNYTSPLGLTVLHDVATHFDPAPEIRYTYTHATNQSVGIDRTQATGSGAIGQYPQPVAQKYESLETCPIDLVLFFHAVRYDQKLTNGKTLIQTLYDRYFDGVVSAVDLRHRWTTLEGKIDPARYAEVLETFDAQVQHARLWRDRMTRFFFELSNIRDERGRVRSQYRLTPATTPAKR